MKGIVFADGSIGYKPLPKVACSSVKEAIFLNENGRNYDVSIDSGRHIHHHYLEKLGRGTSPSWLDSLQGYLTSL